ncbi:SDR family NAD(P)-dependent oxidoreductase [Desulfatiglans anilini]|uniref:SDR family NAD(P)-dependent oxidoreductase n=1 Tax=Desulfatiglans anilini TaxID=90728 RepID=UPI0006860D15|nr:SDR family oxidoreductase [Desulfatiglans anilini]
MENEKHPGDSFFKDKVAIITGASTGIGLGLSRGLLARGAEVYMCSRTPKNIAAAAESLRKHGGRVHAQVLDVRDEDAVNAYIEYVGSRGPIDYIFCNAGVGFGQAFTVTKREDWNTVFDVNLFGVVNCVHAVLPIMIKQGYGHIVNTASVCGIVPLPYQTVYAASKYAVVGFSEDLRYEMSFHNIKVTTVCPGAVDTMIFYRTLDYKLHMDMPKPPEAISIDQAADEILEGVEAGRNIIPVQDFARRMHHAIGANPSEVEETMWALANQRRGEPQYQADKLPGE